MSFECSFGTEGIDYELWIEDDGRVCYAYLFDADGKISGKVWLYNRGSKPGWFEGVRGLPPRNAAPFVADARFTLPTSGDDFSAEWRYEGDVLYACVFIRKALIGILAPGTDPGWSVLAKKDGPVAKVLKLTPPSNSAEIIADIRALRASHESQTDREMTATSHRGRNTFEQHHPQPERRMPKEERRRIRIQHRATWSQDWDEGRYEGLPRAEPGAENSTRKPSDRPVIEHGAGLDEVLGAIADGLYGTTATASDIQLLRDRLPAALVPDWLANALQRYKLAGTSFALTEAQDLSGLGADVMWFTPKQMIEEACELEPGLTVVRSGFLPFGGCQIGTGDPFFLDLRNGSNDPPVVRVPHDYAGGESYPLDAIEVVAPSLTKFLTTAEID